MKTIKPLLLFLLFAFTGFSQNSFSPVLGPAYGINSDNWVLMSNEPENYYLTPPFHPSLKRLLLHSTDGKHWSLLAEREYFAHFLGKDNNLYAVGPPNALYRSVDHGQNWEMLSNTLPSGGKYLDASPSGQLFLGTYSAVYRSNDNGENWELQIESPGSKAIKVAENDLDAWVWSHNSDTVRLWHSPDSGTNWNLKFNDVVPYSNLHNSSLEIGPDGWVYFNVSGDYNRILRSSDNGNNWEETVVKPWAPAQVSCFSIMPDSSLIARMNDGLWYRSVNNSEIWEVYTPGWENNFSYIYHTPHLEVFGIGGSPLHMSLDGEEWEFAAQNLLTAFNYEWLNSNTIYGLTQGGLLHLQDGNISFIDMRDVLSSTVCSPGILEIDPNGVMYYGNCQRVFKSENQSQSWEEISIPGNESIKKLRVYNDVLYVLTENTLFQSTDGGQNWLASEPLSGFYYFTDFIRLSNGNLYIHNFNTLWESIDGGDSFNQVFEDCCIRGLHEGPNGEIWVHHEDSLNKFDPVLQSLNRICVPPVQGIALDLDGYYYHKNSNLLFAAGSIDMQAIVFRSEDLGESWDSIPLNQSWVAHLEGVGLDNHLYASAYGAIVDSYSLFRSDEPVTLVNTTRPEEDLKVKVYPNPGSSQLTVELPLVDKENSIQIVNQEGLVLLEQNANSKVIQINTAELPFGTYLLHWLGSNGKPITTRLFSIRALFTRVRLIFSFFPKLIS